MTFKPSSSFAGNVLKLATGSVFAQGIAVLITPILTRFFLPEAFGVAELFISISAILIISSCLRYERAIMLPLTDDDAANIFCASIVFTIIISMFAFCIVFFADEWIAAIFNAPGLKPYLKLLPLAILTGGVLLAVNFWNSRTKEFGLLSVSRVLNSFSNQSSRLLGGLVGYVNSGTLIISTILGQFLAVLFLVLRTWKKDATLLKASVSPKRMILEIKRYKKFPIFDIWGSLLNTASWQLPAFFLAAFFSPVIVGYYALGTAVIRLPMNILGSSIAQVFYQKASDTRHAGNMPYVVENVFTRLVAIGLFPMLLLCIIGQDLFSLVFGKNWAEAGLYSQILAPWMFFTFISSPLSTLFSVYERQGSALIMQSLIFITRILSLYIGGIMGNVYIALGLFSLSGVIVYGVLSIWNMKLANISTLVFLRVTLKYLLYSLPIGIILVSLKYWINVSSLIISLTSIVSLIVYFVWIIKKDNQLNKFLYI